MDGGYGSDPVIRIGRPLVCFHTDIRLFQLKSMRSVIAKSGKLLSGEVLLCFQNLSTSSPVLQTNQ